MKENDNFIGGLDISNLDPFDVAGVEPFDTSNIEPLDISEWEESPQE